ncbi:hypothetical protein DPMN_035339 [Dreissena polymorpha]|uniref:Uncharacterized protein n=1 Tax=Dreissena polymorpha TaxID=45954 RepID=A0A9D4M9D1_DREPO|nr:hypothetical protein DPMN_035339 [Dreissena polymorpha]
MRQFPCTLTSRRLPCTLTSSYYATFCLAPFGGARCTLTSLSAGTLIRIGDRTYYATSCLAPFGRTRCTLTSPYYATSCLAPFGRTRCTLTSPYYATSCLAPFGRTRCTLTSRRLPIGLNLFRAGLLIRIGGTFRTNKSYPRKRPTYYATSCLASFGRTRVIPRKRPSARLPAVDCLSG